MLRPVFSSPREKSESAVSVSAVSSLPLPIVCVSPQQPQPCVGVSLSSSLSATTQAAVATAASRHSSHSSSSSSSSGFSWPLSLPITVSDLSRAYQDLVPRQQFITTTTTSSFQPVPSSSSAILLESVLSAQPTPSFTHLSTNMASLSSALGSIDSESNQQTPSTSNGSPSFIKGERCVGCGSDTAIRVHYGASSCHGCKAFFRRSVFEGRVYVCSSDNNCDITNESRNRCRACRLRNCLEGGMNPKHVREERSKIERGGQPQGQQPFVAASAATTTSAASVQEGSSEQEADKYKIPEEHQLTLFLCALEKQTEMLTDEDARDSEIMLGEWSRDATLAFGLQNPQLVIKRAPIDWRCDRVMSALDLYSSWYRAFVLHADWAMGIADYRVLPLADQTLLFKQNFMSFGWITYAYYSYKFGNNEKGIPLANGAYIPYRKEELETLEAKWCSTYGIVCKRLIEMIVRPMVELQMTEEEYCLLKTIGLFQQETLLSEAGAAICVRMRDRLTEALSTHIERRFPHLTPVQRMMRSIRLTMLLSSFTYIGQVESNLIQQLTATDLQNLSGIPIEIVNAQQYI